MSFEGVRFHTADRRVAAEKASSESREGMTQTQCRPSDVS
jgi:hypothetical protein